MQTKSKICGVYKITNPEGKSYIGQSKDVYSRFEHHKRKPRITKLKKPKLLTKGFNKIIINRDN
jgi:predicted GIY-YIG superfamily endonuclease